MKRSPLNRKSPMRKSKRKAMSASEKRHAAKVAAIGCIACLLDGNPGTPPELHHPRADAGIGQRSKHGDVLPLCSAHHRGTQHPRIPSIHLDKSTFIARYGTEAELLERVREITGVYGNA